MWKILTILLFDKFYNFTFNEIFLFGIVLNVTAGIGVLGVAKTMMSEIFGTTLPNIADAAFASTYVLMISLFNMIKEIPARGGPDPGDRREWMRDRNPNRNAAVYNIAHQCLDLYNY